MPKKLKKRGGSSSSGTEAGLWPPPAKSTAEDAKVFRQACMALLLLCAALLATQAYLFAYHSDTGEGPPPPPLRDMRQVPRLYTYEIIATHDHDSAAFTQGLLCADLDGARAWSESCEQFWESTGLYGESGVRLVDRASGKVCLCLALMPSTQQYDKLYDHGL